MRGVDVTMAQHGDDKLTSVDLVTGEVPQIVDDDDTIPDHDEELTERDIVKSLALPSLIFIQISTVESIRMQLIRLEVERETTLQFFEMCFNFFQFQPIRKELESFWNFFLKKQPLQGWCIGPYQMIGQVMGILWLNSWKICGFFGGEMVQWEKKTCF